MWLWSSTCLYLLISGCFTENRQSKLVRSIRLKRVFSFLHTNEHKGPIMWVITVPKVTEDIAYELATQYYKSWAILPNLIDPQEILRSIQFPSLSLYWQLVFLSRQCSLYCFISYSSIHWNYYQQYKLPVPHTFCSSLYQLINSFNQLPLGSNLSLRDIRLSCVRLTGWPKVCTWTAWYDGQSVSQ